MAQLKGVLLTLVALVSLSFGRAQNRAEINAANAELREISQLKAKHDTTLASFHQHPRNLKLKKAYVFATVQLGMHTMYSTALPPRQKYPAALRLFKEALAVDPSNKDARSQKELIEAVYRKIQQKKQGHP